MALTKTQLAVHRVIEQLIQPTEPIEKIEEQVVMDDRNGHYLMLNVGWDELHRTHGVVVHIDIKGDFVWVQRDNTDSNIVHALLDQGIPKNRIVVGFHAPYKRQFTDYATGHEMPVNT
jgi:formamidopyrimidine-DNA glycosylase